MNKVTTDELKHRIHYDSVTGLYNKDEFYKKAFAIIQNNLEVKYDIICVNVDRFKLINDLYGMDEGDKLLNYIGKIIMNKLDFSMESCGRLYADNFALCVIRTDGYEEKMVEVAKELLKEYPLDLNISVCFGIYRVENRDISVVSMCDRANMAIKSIKGNYKQRYAFYEESHRTSLLEEQEIINDMYTALKEQQFNVYFQPKYCLAKSNMIGAEALVRWIHPKKGLISPDKFIHVFEKCGFISLMDEYVWEFTCKKIREWLDNGLPVVPISVNVSRVDIYNPKLCENLKCLLNKYNIPINLLELEITETAYTENANQLIEAVHELKSIGFTVEMDDFGTGYSSLNMLNEVPVDVLKLDLRFLKPTKVFGRGANILNSVVSMAKWLNLPVVAEGIETKEQVAFLRSIGCNKGQGFYFAKPMPCNEFEKLFETIYVEEDNKSNELLDTMINLDDFWNPNSQINVLFDHFVGGLCILELRGNSFFILKANDRFFEIININRDTMYAISPHLIDYMLKEDKAQFFKKLELAKKTNGEVIVECRFSNPSSSKIIFMQSRMKVMLNSSERTLFLGSVENITDQKIAEIKLLKNEEKFENIMELIDEVVFDYNLETKRIKYSKNYKTLFSKKPPTYFNPKTFVDAELIYDEDKEIFYNIFTDIKNGKKEISNAKFRIVGLDNQYKWCIASAKGIYDNSNNLIKIIGIIFELDKIKQRLNSVDGELK